MSVLARLLADAEVFHPEYGGGLTNHLPMALIALDQMGATPAQLNAYRGQHVSWLEPMPMSDHAPAAAWPFRKGDRAAFIDLQAEFRGRIAAEGWEPVLRASLPELAPGLSAAAFHAMIRTAMGVVARQPAEIANGLAYWAAHWQRLGVAFGAPAATPAEPTDDPLALLARLRADPRFDFDPKKGPDLIDDALLAAASLGGFGEVVDWLDAAACDVAGLGRAGAAVYAATGDFTALHLVTGAQAVAVLLPYVDSSRLLVPWMWQAMAAAYVALGRPVLPDAETLQGWRGAELPVWPDLLRAAVAEEDEHSVKLSYSALYLGRLTGDRLYRWLAAREVGALSGTALPAWRI